RSSQAGAESDDVLCIVGEMMTRQRPAQERSGERSGKDDRERDQGYCDGSHWVPRPAVVSFGARTAGTHRARPRPQSAKAFLRAAALRARSVSSRSVRLPSINSMVTLSILPVNLNGTVYASVTDVPKSAPTSVALRLIVAKRKRERIRHM